MKTFIHSIAFLILLMGFGASCGSEVEPGDGPVGEAEQAVCVGITNCPGAHNGVSTCVDNLNCGSCGHRCGPGGICVDGACTCDGSHTYCGDADGCIRTTNLAWDEEHCGSCSPCGAGQACSDSECGPRCHYHQDCASGKICVGDKAYWDDGSGAVRDVVYNGGTTSDPTGWDYGACLTRSGSSDADCQSKYEWSGNIGGSDAWLMGSTDDNRIRLFNGICVAAASDPMHCGTSNNNICNGGYDYCMSYSSASAGCHDGQTCPAVSSHAKDVPGYWRQCP